MFPRYLVEQLRCRYHRFFENEIFRRVIKNSGYLLSTNGISAALSMLQGILTARLLGVVGYGTLGTIILFVSTINNLISFRMNELVVKYVGEYSEKNDQYQAAAFFKLAAITEMIASILAFLLILVLAPIGAKYFTKNIASSEQFIFYGLIILVNLIAESSTGLLQIFDQFRRLGAVNLAQSIVTLTLITLTYILHGSLTAVLFCYLVGKSISAISFSTSAIIEANRRWGKGWWRLSTNILMPRRKEFARFAVSTNISASISLITKDSEVLWVSFLRGPLEAGYYRLALSLANLVQMPVDPLPQATYPELSRQVAQNNLISFRNTLRMGSKLAGSYTMLASIFLVVLGQALITFLYTGKFLPAYPALVILMFGLLFANTFYWRRISLLALGKADFPAKVNLVLAAVKIALIFLLVPIYGYLASAALLSGFYITGSLIYLWKTRRLLSQMQAAV